MQIFIDLVRSFLLITESAKRIFLSCVIIIVRIIEPQHASFAMMTTQLPFVESNLEGFKYYGETNENNPRHGTRCTFQRSIMSFRAPNTEMNLVLTSCLHRLLRYVEIYPNTSQSVHPKSVPDHDGLEPSLVH